MPAGGACPPRWARRRRHAAIGRPRVRHATRFKTDRSKAAATASAFPGSADYWERRYANGRNSGAGSYGRLAEFKAGVLNRYVAEHEIGSVIELGCGDGNQLSLARYPTYLGLDVSQTALALCRTRFANDASKTFGLLDAYPDASAELALSLDVIFHLIEDTVFEAYMTRLLDAAQRYAIIYSSDMEPNGRVTAPHVRHRAFSRWIAAHRPDFAPVARIPNAFGEDVEDGGDTSFADFHIYARVTPSPAAAAQPA